MTDREYYIEIIGEELERLLLKWLKVVYRFAAALDKP